MELHLRTKDIDVVKVVQSFKRDYYFKEFKKGGLFNNDTKEGFYEKIGKTEYFIGTKEYILRYDDIIFNGEYFIQKAKLLISLSSDITNLNGYGVEVLCFNSNKDASTLADKIIKLMETNEFISIIHNK